MVPAWCKAVSRYEVACPSPGVGLPRDRFDFVSFHRREQTFQQGTINADCEPMTHSAWMEWATQHGRDGGDMTEQVAKAKLDSMKARPLAFPQDSFGRNNSLRIWAPTRQFARMTIGRAEINEMNASMAPVTNPSDETLNDMRQGSRSAGFTEMSRGSWGAFGGGAMDETMGAVFGRAPGASSSSGPGFNLVAAAPTVDMQHILTGVQPGPARTQDNSSGAGGGSPSYSQASQQEEDWDAAGGAEDMPDETPKKKRKWRPRNLGHNRRAKAGQGLPGGTRCQRCILQGAGPSIAGSLLFVFQILNFIFVITCMSSIQFSFSIIEL